MRGQGDARSAARSPPWRGRVSSGSTSRPSCPRASSPCAPASPCRRPTPAHHPDRAGRARRHALGAGRRHPGHGGAGEPAGRGGLRAALRGGRLRLQRRHHPRRHGGQRGADLGPGHRHAAHLHRGAARGGPRPPAGPVRPGRRRPGRPRGARGARAHPRRGQRRRGHRPGGGGGERRARARPGLPHAPGRRRATTSASSCATCRAATSSWAAVRRTARAGCTTARPSSSRTSPCGSGPACWCAAPWHWPRREPRRAQWADDRLGPLLHCREDGAGHRRHPRHRQDDRRGLRRRRRHGLHLVPQGRRGGGGGGRALPEGHLHRDPGRPLHRGRVPAAGRRAGGAGGRPRHSGQQRRRHLGRAAGRLRRGGLRARARPQRQGRLPPDQVPGAAPAEGRDGGRAGAGHQHRVHRRHRGADARDVLLLRRRRRRCTS